MFLEKNLLKIAIFIGFIAFYTAIATAVLRSPIFVLVLLVICFASFSTKLVIKYLEEHKDGY